MRVERRVVTLAVIAVNSFQICTTWYHVAANVTLTAQPKETIRQRYKINHIERI